jgi:hypothetical protein
MASLLPQLGVPVKIAIGFYAVWTLDLCVPLLFLLLARAASVNYLILHLAA